jgi:hypothetical protein
MQFRFGFIVLAAIVAASILTVPTKPLAGDKPDRPRW